MFAPDRRPRARVRVAMRPRAASCLTRGASVGVLLSVCATFLWVAGAGGEIYRWTDAQGRTHFSQDLGQVPAGQRASALEAAKKPARDSPIQRYEVVVPAKPAPAGARSAATEASPTVRIPVQRAGTSMVVMVRLNNSVNARFVVDTGASDLLLPQSVAKRLGLKPSGRTKVYSTANGLVTHDVVVLDSVALGGATATGVVASISPSMDIGLLGLSFFNHFQYSIDPVAGTIELTPNGLKEAGLIRAGRSKAQWRAEYVHLHKRIEYNEARRERVLSSHTRTHATLEKEREDLDRQLAVLDLEADRGRVPYSWRR